MATKYSFPEKILRYVSLSPKIAISEKTLIQAIANKCTKTQFTKLKMPLALYNLLVTQTQDGHIHTNDFITVRMSDIRKFVSDLINSNDNEMYINVNESFPDTQITELTVTICQATH